jgi:hypothetical protein
MTVEKEIVSFILSGQNLSEASIISETIASLQRVSLDSDLDAEYIVVLAYPTEEVIDELRNSVSTNPVQVVVVGQSITWDQEVFAGLSRANGDYAFIVGEAIEPAVSIFPKMLKLARLSKNDVIGARKISSVVYRMKHIRETILFMIIGKNSDSTLTIHNCGEVLITRKALNWILRDISSARCMLEMFLIPGLTYEFVESGANSKQYRLKRSEYSRLLTRYTQIPMTLLKSCYLLTSFVMVFTSLNALSVRWRGVNLLNQIENQIPGWTTLVLLLSFGFTVMIYGLFLSLRTIIHFARESSSKPSHVVKSVYRL